MLLCPLNALGLIQSVQGQDAADSRFIAPATEIEISSGSEPQEAAPRSLSFEMASMEAAAQIPACIHPSGRIWMQLSEGDSCTVVYSCSTHNIPGSYLYIHHGNHTIHPDNPTAERGKDVRIAGPDSVLIHEVNGIRSTNLIIDLYEAIPDGISEGDEEMSCYCSGYRDGPRENEFGHPIQIRDLDGWTVSDVTAHESHGNITFLLEFPRPVERDLTIKYSTKAGTAKAGTDYTSANGLVTVRKGQISAYIGVLLVRDNIPELAETFDLVTISDQFSGIPEQKATGTIVEGSHFIIEPSPLSVDEGGQNTYTVALGERPSRDVSVAITGHTGTDLALDKTSLTFMPSDWDRPQTVTVTAAADDDAIDDREALIHTATAPGGVFDGVEESLWVTITDKVALRLIVTPDNLTLFEGASGQAFEVKLGSSPPAGNDVTVAVNVGPTLNGKVSLSEPHLNFTSSNWSTGQSVTVTAEGDADAAVEVGTLELLASGGGYNGQTGSVYITVYEDDIAELVVAPTRLNLVEGGSGKGFTVRLSSAPVGNDVTVQVNIPSGLDGKVSVTKSSLTFTSSDWSVDQEVEVTAEEDADAADEAGLLDLSASGGLYSGQTGSVYVTVYDNVRAYLVVVPTTLNLVEGGSGKGFTVRLGLVPVENDVTVRVNISSGLDGKVSVTKSRLTFTSSDWKTDQLVTVTAEADADVDNEAGLVQLSASGSGYDGISEVVKMTVVDDDVTYRIDIEPSSVQVSEGAGPARFKVRLNRHGETAVTVRYTTHDESAHAGLDYLVPATNVLTFELGGNLEKWIDVPILDDALHEEEETFTLELTDAQGAELGNATGRATIMDNDAAPNISIGPVVYVREGGIANVYLNLNDASSEPVMVPYSTSDVTATAGEDYEAVSAGSVTIEPGETGTVIQVPTEDDTVHEGREVFLVQLDGGQRSMVTILDNDRLPQLFIGDVTVSEDGGHAQLAVSLSGLSAVPVGVAYATADGTAQAELDYTRTLGTLVFAPGETVRHVRVPVLRDEVVEVDEGFVVLLSAPEHGVLLDAEGDVTIKDDPLEVSIHDGTKTENSEELVMAVRLNYGSSKVVSVQFAVTGGTATSDVDYEATQGLVVFETGSTEAQVRIPLIDDDMQEGNETVEVTLSNPTNAQIGQAMATGTIVDDETAAGVQVRAITVSQIEAVFVVGLLAPVVERMTGRYRTVDGTAWAGEDYERMEGVLEFGPGEIRKEVRVPLLRAQGSGEAFALMVELGDETVREEVVLGIGTEDTASRARLGRSVAVHIVEAVSERMEGSLVGCTPRPFPGQRVRASHLLSGCGMQASGERISVWGRGAYSRLQSGGVSGADVVTASLGADYRAGGRWLMGMVVSRSEALACNIHDVPCSGLKVLFRYLQDRLCVVHA